MRLSTAVLVGFLFFLVVPARCADTNVLIIPSGDHRAGAIYFVDECLTRGLTNSISVSDLRKWATNTIRVYQQREAVSAKTNTVRHSLVIDADVPQIIRTIQSRIPSCRNEEPAPIDGWDEFVKQYSKSFAISREEAERRLRTIGPDPDPPTIDFWRSSLGNIEAVTITWYIYGVIIGPESFKPEWEHDPWYHRKLADGIYLWHGYK
jgi:hypothetical protein